MANLEEESNPKYCCNICNTLMTDKTSYTKHLAIHDMKIECVVCRKPFRNIKVRSEHYHRKHKGVVLNCDSCDVVYDTMAAMDGHRKFHTKELPYICLICLRSYGNILLLKEHIQRHQTEILRIMKRNYECTSDEDDDCSKSNSNLLPEGYICDVCDKIFSKRHSLLKHSLTHEQYGIYKCECCNKIFRKRSAIIKHIQCGVDSKSNKEKSNKKVKQFMCETCGKVYKESCFLVMHRKKHLPPGNFPCHLCDKVFPYEDRLRGHIYRHKMKEFKTGPDGKPITYDCQFCDKKFSSFTKRKTHEQLHTENYTCTFCGRTFNKKWNLKTHVAIHLGDKPYSCSYCGAKYTDRSNLAKHIAKHPPKFEAKPVIGNETLAMG